MSIHKTEAIVLSRYETGETSLIANFYTRDFGRISAVLKGIRQEPGKFASNIEPFSLNELVFYYKRNSEVHLVSQCDLKEGFTPLRGNINKSGAATLMLELILAVMQQEDKNEAVFDLAIASLSEMQANPFPDKIATIFKIKLLELSGFKPHFESCVSCGAAILSESKFSLSLGGLLCSACCRKDLSSRSIFRGTVASILHIQKNDFRENLKLGMNPQIKKELELILDAFLNFHLGRELKAQRVMNKMAAEAGVK